MESKTNQAPHQPVKYDYRFKVIMLGDYGVGKTSTSFHYLHGEFKSTFKTTLGIDYEAKMVNYEDNIIKLLVWDYPGEEIGTSATRVYYTNAHGIIILYDVTNRSSFESIDQYITDVRESSAFPNCQIVLFGNKSDNEEARTVGYAEGFELASKNGAAFYEGSAKEGVGINEAFNALIGKMMAEAREGKFVEEKKPAFQHYPLKDPKITNKKDKCY